MRTGKPAPGTVDRTLILAEIKRTAAENGGAPLGVGRFRTETGIKETDWRGRYWVRWSDALKEAGLAPNALQGAYDEAFLWDQLALLVRELGHFPVVAEFRMKTRQDPQFPNSKTFTRFGPKSAWPSKLISHCRARGGFDDVIGICAAVAESPEDEGTPATSAFEIGFVYLLKFGKNYKIGRSNAVGRRERELAIQLPEKARTVHTIRTDDPVGIEAYWHNRFDGKRGNGEWFNLDATDVAAFRRRKFM